MSPVLKAHSVRPGASGATATVPGGGVPDPAALPDAQVIEGDGDGDAAVAQTLPSAAVPAPVLQPIQPAPAGGPGYSFEVLVSAGPRKDPHEYENGLYRELGEDAAGLITLPGQTIFWLADGTSDEAVLPGFSARLLAQDAGAMLGQAARRLWVIRSGRAGFHEVIEEARTALLDLWNRRAVERWRLLRERSEEGRFLAALDLGGDGWLRKSWSSTFVAGCLYHDSGLLEAVNLGDGGFVLAQEEAGIQTIDRSSQRLWLCMERPPDNRLAASAPPLTVKMEPHEIAAGDVLRFSRVRLVLCMTDGATAAPVQTLVRSAGRGADAGGIESLAALIKGLRQKTYDDRTLIMGSRLDLGSVA